MLVWIPPSAGQSIQVASPLDSISDSYFENFGTRFGFRFGTASGPGSRVVGLLPNQVLTPNVGFSQNNFLSPTFGGASTTGSQFGFGRRSSNGAGFSLGFDFAQGSSRTFNSVSSSLTLPNGGFGSLVSGRIRPFVTGVIPVVGTDNAVTRAIASGQLRTYEQTENTDRQSRSKQNSSSVQLSSSANFGDKSVADIEAEKQRGRLARILEYDRQVQHAKEAEKRQEYGQIRTHIRKARKLTEDPEKLHYLRNWMKKYRGK